MSKAVRCLRSLDNFISRWYYIWWLCSCRCMLYLCRYCRYEKSLYRRSSLDRLMKLVERISLILYFIMVVLPAKGWLGVIARINLPTGSGILQKLWLLHRYILTIRISPPNQKGVLTMKSFPWYPFCILKIEWPIINKYKGRSNLTSDPCWL